MDYISFFELLLNSKETWFRVHHSVPDLGDERKLFREILSLYKYEEKMTTTEEIKKMSLQFLRKLYELSGEDDSERFDTQEIFNELELDSKSDLALKIMDYLLDEELITTVIGGANVGITQKGIKEAKDASSKMKV